MKHWLLWGTMVVVVFIFFARSRVSQTSTLPPPATSPATTTAAATSPTTSPAMP